MRGAVAAIVITAGLFLLAAIRANAQAVEFCPAVLGPPHPMRGELSWYSFYFEAQSPRTISGRAIVETDSRYYQFSFSDVPLVRDVVHYKNFHVSYDRVLYRSKPQFIQIESGERIRNWWIDQAQTSGEQAFGWDSRGSVPCLPDELEDAASFRKPKDFDIALPTSPDPLERTRAAGDTVYVPQPIDTPPGVKICETPFAEAEPTKIPDLKAPLDVGLGDDVYAVVDVIVNADGSVADALIEQPSGTSLFDSEALDLARKSTYSNAVALCLPAPGRFTFLVTWSQDLGAYWWK